MTSPRVRDRAASVSRATDPSFVPPLPLSQTHTFVLVRQASATEPHPYSLFLLVFETWFYFVAQAVLLPLLVEG